MSTINTSRITIKRTRGPDVTFENKFIIRAEGPRDEPPVYGRWHDIAVYVRADGMWAVQIDFGTLSVHESPHTDVEIVDRPDEVETVLLCYSPIEHVRMSWISPGGEVDKQQFLRSIHAEYDTLINCIVQEMQPYVEAFQAQSSAEEPPRPTRWQGLLEMIGLR